MHEDNCGRYLRKITIRNFITMSTISVFLAIVLHIVFVDITVTESPVLMFILGSFMTAVTMIYTFYYRKNRTKFGVDDYNGDGICPCCGQEFKKI